MSHFAPSITAMEKLTEAFARKLTLRYEEQIKCLTTEKSESGVKGLIAKTDLIYDKKNGGAEDLAECAVVRVLEGLQGGIIDSNKSEKSIINNMVASVFITDKKQGKLLLQDKKIETNPDLNLEKWTDQGVFKQSGIRTKKGEYFKNTADQGACRNPEKYGYRLGKEKEAERLNLTQQCKSTFIVDIQQKNTRNKTAPTTKNTFFNSHESKKEEEQKTTINVRHKNKCCNLL